MRTIDLFSGCGGLSLGFQAAGFEVVAAFDNWEPAIKLYKENFDHPIIPKDLSQVADYGIFALFEPNCIIGGPPCQDFSSAGKRNEDLGRGDLTISFANIVDNIRPEWLVMENVERILKTQKLKEAIKIFKKAGYGLSSQVLDASYCGVPQARKRFFLVGHLGSDDGFLEPYLLKNQRRAPMTVHDFFGDALDVEFYYRHPRSYQRRGMYSVHEPSATIRGVNRPVPKGYKPHPNDACEIKPDLRPLTTLERSYIQTFPRGFKWLGTKTEQEQMIGNAVPVNLGKFVGNCIQEYIHDTAIGKSLKPQLQLELAFAL